MTNSHHAPIFLCALLLSLAAGCGEDSPDAAPDAAASCLFDPRAQDFEVGMAVAGEDGVQVVIASADLVPPERFENTWALQVQDAQGQAIEVSNFTVEPFMPDHGHGTPKPPIPVPGTATGEFDMGPFDLWMPGIWELRFSVTTEQGLSNPVLTLCIEE